MAQKQMIVTSDDLDGTEFDPDLSGATDVIVGMPQPGGRMLYRKIDLADKNLKAYEKAMRKFWDVGRSVKIDEVAGQSKRARRPKPDGPAPDDVRVWARENGYEVADRGRVPQSIREAYEKAQA